LIVVFYTYSGINEGNLTMGFIHDMFEIGKVLIEALNGRSWDFSWNLERWEIGSAWKRSLVR